MTCSDLVLRLVLASAERAAGYVVESAGALALRVRPRARGHDVQDGREGLGHFRVLCLGVWHVAGHTTEMEISESPLDLSLALIRVLRVACVDLRRGVGSGPRPRHKMGRSTP